MARPREETTRGSYVVAAASGEQDEAPQHFGTPWVSPPAGGNKPRCRKNHAPGRSNGVLITRMIGGVGRRKPPNHQCRPAASRNEKLSWRSDASETNDMEPSQKIATTMSKEATVHSANFRREVKYTSKHDGKLHWKNTVCDRQLSERKLASSETVLGDRLRHFMTFTKPTVAGKDHSTSKYVVVERAFLHSVWNGAYNCRAALLAGIFDAVSPQVVRFFQDEVCCRFAKSESQKNEFKLVVQAGGLAVTRKWLFQSRPPHIGEYMSIPMESMEGFGPGATYWTEFSASKKCLLLRTAASIGPHGVFRREEYSTEWIRFLTVCVEILGRGVWHQHCRRKDTHLCENGRPRVPNGESRSGSGLGMRDQRKGIPGRGGFSILCGWMYHTAVLFLLLLSLCGTTSVDAQVEEINDGNIGNAVKCWKQSTSCTSTIATYGRIEDWDTSRVTTMRKSKLSFLYCVV